MPTRSPRSSASGSRRSIPEEDADVGGVGGTLAGNALSMAAIRATLTEVLTDEAFERMLPLGERWAAGVDGVIREHDVPWHVARLGARAEYHFMPTPPRNGSEQWANADADLERFLHLWAMNRGVLMTPFHNMALMSPGDDRGRRRPPHRGVRRGGGGPVRARVMTGDRRPGRRLRPAVVLAIVLDIVVVAAAIVAVANGFSPIVLAFAAILAMAPWASIIDQRDGPGRRR